jgi:hypothetical protein
LAQNSGVRYAEEVTGCEYLRRHHYCQHPTYGPTVRYYCQSSCGGCSMNGTCFMNDNVALHDFANYYGYGQYIRNCRDARDHVDCDHPEYGWVMRSYCPCSC